MNLISAGLTSAILAAGLAGSVAAYRGQATRASEVVVPVRASEPRTVVQWAPCQAPSRLENGVCVTDVVRTVVRPAPSAAGPTTSTSSAGTELQQQVDVGGGDNVEEDVYGVQPGDVDGERGDDNAGEDAYGVEREDQSDEPGQDDQSGTGYTYTEEREDDD